MLCDNKNLLSQENPILADSIKNVSTFNIKINDSYDIFMRTKADQTKPNPFL